MARAPRLGRGLPECRHWLTRCDFTAAGEASARKSQIRQHRRGTHCAVDAMDYYEELGINRAATDIDINKA